MVFGGVLDGLKYGVRGGSFCAHNDDTCSDRLSLCLADGHAVYQFVYSSGDGRGLRGSEVRDTDSCSANKGYLHGGC